MGSIEDNKWVDMIIDKIGFALTKVDKSIQKGIEFWAELTKDIYDDQQKHDTTGQPNNGKSGEEDSFQDKSVAEVKERPIQHWAMCFRKAKDIPNQHRAMCIGEPKESPSQHWAMCASKIPESLIREQWDEDYYENDCDDDGYYNEEEEEDETTFSESSKDMWEINLRTSTTSYRPNCNHHHKEEASGSSLTWKDGYGLLKDVDTPYGAVDELWNDDYDEKEEEEDETTVSKSCDENMWKTKSREQLRKINKSGRPLGPYYVAPIRFLRNENDAMYQKRGNPYQLPKNDNTWDYDDDEEEEESSDWESRGKTSELNLKTSATSYIPWQYQHHRNEEDNGRSSLRGRSGNEMLKNDDNFSEEEGDSSWDNEEDEGSSLRGRSGYEMLKNDDDTCPEEDGDSSWDNEEDVKEWIGKHGMMSDVSNVSLVGHEDEDEDKLQGFVNVNTEDEVETLSPECDWVYVTRD